MTVRDAELERERSLRFRAEAALERAEARIRALESFGDLERLTAIHPPLLDLLKHMGWLEAAAEPGPDSVSYDSPNHGPKKRDAYPMPGQSTSWYRRKQNHVTNELRRLVDFIDRALNPDFHTAPPEPDRCQNADCRRYRKAARFGARRCDDCGLPLSGMSATVANGAET